MRRFSSAHHSVSDWSLQSSLVKTQLDAYICHMRSKFQFNIFAKHTRNDYTYKKKITFRHTSFKIPLLIFSKNRTTLICWKSSDPSTARLLKDHFQHYLMENNFVKCQNPLKILKTLLFPFPQTKPDENEYKKKDLSFYATMFDLSKSSQGCITMTAQNAASELFQFKGIMQISVIFIFSMANDFRPWPSP